MDKGNRFPLTLERGHRIFRYWFYKDYYLIVIDRLGHWWPNRRSSVKACMKAV